MVDAEISFQDTQDPWGCNCGPINYVNCSRDPARTPMQWSGSAENAGFSGPGVSTWLPVNDNYKEINLDSQEMENYGHWFNVKTLLSLRKHMELLRIGSTKVSTIPSSTNVLCIQRKTSQDILISLSNLGDTSVVLDLESMFDGKLLLVLFSTTQSHVIGGEYLSQEFTLFPYEGVIVSFVE